MDPSHHHTSRHNYSSAYRAFSLFVLLNILAIGIIFLTGCSKTEYQINTPDGMAVLDDYSIDNAIKYSDGNLLVHFTSYDPNCGYCADSNPYIDNLMLQYKDKLEVARISWEPWNSYSSKSKAVTDKYWIRGIPLMILYKKNGEEVWRGTGHTTENTDKIESLLKECCS